MIHLLSFSTAVAAVIPVLIIVLREWTKIRLYDDSCAFASSHIMIDVDSVFFKRFNDWSLFIRGMMDAIFSWIKLLLSIGIGQGIRFTSFYNGFHCGFCCVRKIENWISSSSIRWGPWSMGSRNTKYWEVKNCFILFGDNFLQKKNGKRSGVLFHEHNKLCKTDVRGREDNWMEEKKFEVTLNKSPNILYNSSTHCSGRRTHV